MEGCGCGWGISDVMCSSVVVVAELEGLSKGAVEGGRAGGGRGEKVMIGAK